MLVIALNPGHDGAVAAIKDQTLLLSLESEQDSFERHSVLTPTTLLNAVERLGEIPDVVALGGWTKEHAEVGNVDIGAGYFGAERVEERSMNFFGKQVTLFSSSHERSHIMMAIGMAPRDESPLRAVLVWEGGLGSLYLVDTQWRVVRDIPVLSEPGTRFAFLFALADPTFPARGGFPRLEDSGRLMALAAFGDPSEADAAVAETVERILEAKSVWPAPKHEFRDSPLYNAGVEADVTKVAASLLTQRLFGIFSAAAEEHLPRDIPLHISGGCGLNCDWNIKWRELGHFSSVFVPPCANDSGAAIGAAIDAQVTLTGDPYIDWDVYRGREFEWDAEPDPRLWERRDPQRDEVAEALADGRVFAWVQGRSEIGPRALGNRSILAEPSDRRTRERLNRIKQREGYRPIAPVCRIEDAGKVFDRDFHDPHMLYFRMVTTPELGAVTHVDGSARCQTVSRESNEPLHDLLSAVAARRGIGVLCNTSLNFKGLGFINRMSDLLKYCETRGIEDIVVPDMWFQRVEGSHWILASSLLRPWTKLSPPATVERLRSYLVAHDKIRDATIVSVLAYAGLRPREVLSLRWSDVGKRTLRASGAEVNEGRARRVRLLQSLAEDLALWRDTCQETGGDALVFPGMEGRQLSRAEWDAWREEVFVPALRSCGLDVFRPYDLRDTFCCLSLYEGMTFAELARQLGIKTSAIRRDYERFAQGLADQGFVAISAELEIRKARFSPV